MKPRLKLWVPVLVLVILLLGGFIAKAIRNYMQTSGQYTLYIGGYGNATVKCHFNSKNMTCGILSDFKASNPSFIVLTPSGRNLYGVSESGRSSGLWGYRNNSGDILGEVKDGGADPCHLAYFSGYLFTANYGKGGVAVYPLDTARSIKPASQVINFVSESKEKKLSRVHMVKIFSSKKTGTDYLLASDKGLDCVHLFRIGADTSSGISSENLLNEHPLRLYRCNSSKVQVPSGYGPRHIEVSKDGKYMYLLCETSGRVLVYSITEKDKNLIFSLIQDAVADTKNMQASADIHLSPDGRFLYASNRRGRDGIAIFKVEENGTVSRTAFQVTKQWPRSFALSADGDYMFVCCQKDKCVQIFSIDKTSGYLKNTGCEVNFPELEPSAVVVRED